MERLLAEWLLLKVTSITTLISATIFLLAYVYFPRESLCSPLTRFTSPHCPSIPYIVDTEVHLTQGQIMCSFAYNSMAALISEGEKHTKNQTIKYQTKPQPKSLHWGQLLTPHLWGWAHHTFPLSRAVFHFLLPLPEILFPKSGGLCSQLPSVFCSNIGFFGQCFLHSFTFLHSRCYLVIFHS